MGTPGRRRAPAAAAWAEGPVWARRKATPRSTARRFSCFFSEGFRPSSGSCRGRVHRGPLRARREDIVGTLSSTTGTGPSEKSKRPKPHNKRVWASVKEDSWDVIDEAFTEAKRLDHDHDKRWVAIVDGGADQLEGVLECIGRAG